MPKVSVVIPVYNANQYLSQCLDSILGQSLNDIEIICVDDGSTDNSLEILRGYEVRDSRIQVIAQENTSPGAGQARNRGISVAKGEYLSVLDCDDFFDLTMLELLVESAEKYDTDIVLCDAYYYNNITEKKIEPSWVLNKKVLPEQRVFSYRDCPSHIFQITMGAAWNMLLRRDFVMIHNLQFQSVHHADDMFFAYMAMTKARRITTVDKRFIFYRVSNVNSQKELVTNWPNGAYEACLALKNALIRENIYATVKRSFVNKAIEYMIWYLEAMKSWKAFSSLWLNARGQYFKDLDIDCNEKEYFYRNHYYEWYERIIQKYPDEWVYERYFTLKSSLGMESFPFPKEYVKEGSRIVLYGAGDVGKSFYTQLIYSRYCQVILWVDKEWESIGPPVSEVSKIVETSYDIIIIAILCKEAVENIKKELMNQGIFEEMMIWPFLDTI